MVQVLVIRKITMVEALQVDKVACHQAWAQAVCQVACKEAKEWVAVRLRHSIHLISLFQSSKLSSTRATKKENAAQAQTPKDKVNSQQTSPPEKCQRLTIMLARKTISECAMVLDPQLFQLPLQLPLVNQVAKVKVSYHLTKNG